ncbi:hypothetical protein [Sphingobium sp.]|uniref:hypothetical protein n=1 Tax=Sphingobium sp. TaxID=1912891 RepID=UPI0025DAA6D8|nr:hypothetical protein [Sphingobium sp.]
MRITPLLLDALSAMQISPTPFIDYVIRLYPVEWMLDRQPLDLPSDETLQVHAVCISYDVLEAEVHTAAGVFMSNGEAVTFVTPRLPETVIGQLPGRRFQEVAEIPLLTSGRHIISDAFSTDNQSLMAIIIDAPPVEWAVAVSPCRAVTASGLRPN